MLLPGLILGAALALWLLNLYTTSWRCPACARFVWGSDLDPRAFCTRCGAPRPRGRAREKVPLQVTSARRIPHSDHERIERVLVAERVAEALPSGTRATARIVTHVPAGTLVLEAHPTWIPSGVAQIAGLPPFPKQEPFVRVPGGIFRVEVDCVERQTGGMGSHFGFEGLFVSLLVSLADGKVWDARATDAD